MKLTISSCKRFFFNPLKKIFHIFKFRFRKPLFIRRLIIRRRNHITTQNKHRRIHRSIFRSLTKARRSDGDDDVATIMELKSFSDTTNTHQNAPFPSPLTPAYVRNMFAAAAGEVVGFVPDEVGDVCGSFEKFLAEMIVEQREGHLRNIMEVEDLIYCWENLNCPVFMDLVCRFYRELCTDVFSDNNTLINSDII